MAVSLDVQKKINKRRKVVDPVEYTERHERARRFLDGVDEVSLWMSGAVLSMLSEFVDDLAISGDVRTSFQKCCRRLLCSAASREERVMFFHEAIPGFTVLLVKKEGWGQSVASPAKAAPKTKTSSRQNASQIEEERAEALEAIIGAYVNRTGNRVMSIDGSDVSLILFPVNDLKKNLQEMGFFSA